MIVAVIYIAFTLLIHYKALGYGLIMIIFANLNDRRKMLLTSIAYLISAVLLIGIPMGAIKISHPEARNAEQQIIKEVKEWIG